MNKFLLPALLLGACAIGAGGAVVATHLLKDPAPPVQQATRFPGMDPLQPITHAQAAGVLTCAEGIVRAARGAIEPGVGHRADSSWVTAAPDGHIFSSVSALDYRNPAAPKAVSVLTATPTPGQGCDTAAVQVHPTSRPCAAIEADLAKDQDRSRSDLNGVALIKGAGGAQRHLLLPAPGGQGCVIVAVAVNVSAR